MQKVGDKYLLELTWEQFDKLHEATDIMAMDQIFTENNEHTVEYLAEKYIHEEGPKFEMEWNSDNLEDES